MSDEAAAQPEDFGAAGYPTIAEAQAGADQGVALQAWLDAGAAQGAACALGDGEAI